MWWLRDSRNLPVTGEVSLPRSNGVAWQLRSGVSMFWPVLWSGRVSVLETISGREIFKAARNLHGDLENSGSSDILLRFTAIDKFLRSKSFSLPNRALFPSNDKHSCPPAWMHFADCWQGPHRHDLNLSRNTSLGSAVTLLHNKTCVDHLLGVYVVIKLRSNLSMSISNPGVVVWLASRWCVPTSWAVCSVLLGGLNNVWIMSRRSCAEAKVTFTRQLHKSTTCYARCLPAFLDLASQVGVSGLADVGSASGFAPISSFGGIREGIFPLTST